MISFQSAPTDNNHSETSLAPTQIFLSGNGKKITHFELFMPGNLHASSVLLIQSMLLICWLYMQYCADMFALWYPEAGRFQRSSWMICVSKPPKVSYELFKGIFITLRQKYNYNMCIEKTRDYHYSNRIMEKCVFKGSIIEAWQTTITTKHFPDQYDFKYLLQTETKTLQKYLFTSLWKGRHWQLA